MADFDQIIDRKNAPSSKWNPAYLNSLFGSTDILPFWIADMDFRSPRVLLDAIRAKADYGILAYEYSTPGFYESLIAWIKRHQGTELAREHILPSPSIGTSMGVFINAFTEENDGVITQPPVFMEYKTFIRNNRRKQVKNKLIQENGIYRIDFEDLEKKCSAPENKILIVCNPHNPVGQIWGREEMIKMADICRQNGVLLISDEVHGDVVYPKHRFSGYLTLPETYFDTVVSVYSPVKTFNLGGFTDSFIFVKNEELKNKIAAHLKKYSLGKTNGVVRAGLEAAFRGGEEWLKELISYLSGNIDIIEDVIRKNDLPVSFQRPAASYQLWLDFRKTGMQPAEVHEFLSKKAKVGMNAGYWFGREGAGFTRMNIASPAAVIREGMERIARAFNG